LAQIFISIDSVDEATDTGTMIFDNVLKNWSETEPGGATKIFATKSGTYVYKDGDTTLNSGVHRVGVLNGFNPDTVAPGKHGHGLSDEGGGAFNWTR
jgi:hypothetical protein